MFRRLAEQYRALIQDLVLSLQALAESMRQQGLVATCYVCGDGAGSEGASFVAGLGDGHMVRFLVSNFGISWVESRDGHELVKLEGADAIHELHRVARTLKEASLVDRLPLADAA
jgi:xanthine dehydrogenase iron-sulfur cluster and FAD-binding subunit A